MKTMKMNLLNTEEIEQVKGGAASSSMRSLRDVIYSKCVKLIGDITIVNCATYEASCGSGAAFTYNCNSSTFSSSCTGGTFTITQI